MYSHELKNKTNGAQSQFHVRPKSKFGQHKDIEINIFYAHHPLLQIK
jgi:hypothetical protein